MAVWLLIITVLGDATHPKEFLAGEYQTRDRCVAGAKMQLGHWKRIYKKPLRWACLPTIQMDPEEGSEERSKG
jgi:hypothetical protein